MVVLPRLRLSEKAILFAMKLSLVKEKMMGMGN